MAKTKGAKKALNFVAWLTGVIVALAVGFGLIGGTLSIMYIGYIANQILGWVVLVTTLLGVILAVAKL